MSTPTVANTVVKKTMRDSFLAEILRFMDEGEKVYFLCADFGAPTLDLIRERHPDRFINVGIAEQNLVNVATGLALEGFTVYAYAIAPFITMRCFEQIRVNLAILSQVRPMNVNLIGVGAGFSYEVSGPTHHCLEDLSIMRTLPNLDVISPSDWVTATQLANYTLKKSGPKYLRFDAKPQPQVYSEMKKEDLENGFAEIKKGQKVCLLSTGVLTHQAISVAKELEAQGKNVGVIDLFFVKGFHTENLIKTLLKYEKIITLEEGFIGKGGVDAAIGHLILERQLPLKLKAMGLKEKYLFHVGSRDYLHKKNNLDAQSIMAEVH